ncbi:MAG: hypothetical protein HZA08_13035 [Nitrospirae bacterium]|nr:hypothetical protein [Nitrospirota bacterium]
MEKKVVESVSEWSGVLKDFFRQIHDGSITKSEFQDFLVHRKPFQKPDIVTEWEDFYRDIGINCDLSSVLIPNDPGGFSRVLFVVAEVTPQWIYDKSNELFPCWKWTEGNLDEIIISERIAKNRPYAIRVRDRVEADEELKNHSAYDIKDQMTYETFEERMVHELKFFKETGEHLDRLNVTLCAGSCYYFGYVPRIRWYDGKLLVSRYRFEDRDDRVRPRVVVS